MQNTMHRSFFVAALVGGALLSACGDVVDAAASEPEGSSAEAIDLDVLAAARELRDLERTKPEAPVRLTGELPRSRDPLPDVDPVAYSDAAGAWRRRLYLPGEEPAEKVQTFARSAERFYLADRNGAEVWIFERNPVAPLQGSGTTFEPDEQMIVDLSWGELIELGHGPTWNEVVCFGVGPQTLATLEDTGERERAHGLEFRVLRGDEVEIVWNDEHALPLRITNDRGGVKRVGELTELRLERDDDLLRRPEERHPGWGRMDLVDWREEHHDTH